MMLCNILQKSNTGIVGITHVITVSMSFLGRGKYLSTYENSFIVSKAYNFNLSERLEVGYTWSEEHNLRSMFELKGSMDYQNKPIIYNCTHTLPGFNFIPLYEIAEILYGITIKIPKCDFECTF